MAEGVRVCSRADVERLLGWAADEGWNPGRADATPFHAADPLGFLMAFEDGRPVGGISVVKYSSDYAFLGLYIVRPEHRGRGIGMKLWNAGVARLAGCTVGLDGVVAQQANYARSGFVLAHRQIRFGGVATGGALSSPTIELADVPFDEIASFDRRYFPAPRPAFLATWTTQPDVRARAIVRNGRLAAVGVRRPCRKGFKIGPLFAADPSCAEILLADLTADVAGQPIFLDVPEPNVAGCRLAERFDLSPVFETARMYRGPSPQYDRAGVFGVTSFELG